MKLRLPTLALSLALLTGCSTPEWRGLHGGVQNVQPFQQFNHRQNADGVSVYGIALWGVAGGTAHVQPILPVNGGPPLLGVGIDWRLDTLFTKPKSP